MCSVKVTDRMYSALQPLDSLDGAAHEGTAGKAYEERRIETREFDQHPESLSSLENDANVFHREG